MNRRRLAVSRAAIDLIYSDPAPDPVAIFAAQHSLPEDLAEVLIHFHASMRLWTTGTRFERAAKAGWNTWTAEPCDRDAVDTFLASRPDWRQEANIWTCTTAKARVLDDELIVFVNYAAAHTEAPR